MDGTGSDDGACSERYTKTMTVTVTKIAMNGRSVGNVVSRTVGRTVLGIGAGRPAYCSNAFADMNRDAV